MNLNEDIIVPVGRHISSTKDLLECVFNNIRVLATHRPEILTDFSAWDILENHTKNILDEMEQSPLKSLRSSIRRRRRRRQKRKRKLKAKEMTATAQLANKVHASVQQMMGNDDTRQNTDEYSTNRNTWRTGERFLVLFEQLEHLIFARIRDRQSTTAISRKLLALKKIWMDVMKEHKSPENSRTPSLEQWYELLFGEGFRNCGLPPVVPSLKHFIYKR